MAVLQLHDVTRVYPEAVPVVALSGVTLAVRQGEFVAIVGRSGSGKSTLLNLLGLIDRPTSGHYVIDGVDAHAMSEPARAEMRSRTVGFIFQSYHLMPRRSAVENVELGLLYQGAVRSERRARALLALERVGMASRAEHPANKLSGGEQQRVAIARAIVGGASVIVADEPTGNLDNDTSAVIVELLLGFHRGGTTVILVTHDGELANIATRQVVINDGVLVTDTTRGDGASAAVAAASVTPAPKVGATGGAWPRIRDVLAEAYRAVAARWRRSAALVAGVAIAVALVVVTIGLSQTASAQVSARFDATRNREVTVTVPPTGDAAGTQLGLPDSAAGIERRVRGIAGVEAAGVLGGYDQHSVSALPRAPARRIPLAGASPGLFDAVRARVHWAAGHLPRLGTHEAVVGTVAARQLALAPLESDPVVFVDGVPFGVVGVLRNVGRAPALLSSIVMRGHDAHVFGAPQNRQVLIATAAGAAPQVARQAPIALDPVAPDRLAVDAPVDPQTLRAEIQSDLRTVLLALTIVAALASLVGVGNAMLMNVVERTGEIGLRRALGARSAQILGQIAAEASIIGLIGGLAGLAVGAIGVLAVTVAQRWEPVLDLRLAPLALAGGALVGVLGGAIPAVRASRIQASDALRR